MSMHLVGGTDDRSDVYVSIEVTEHDTSPHPRYTIAHTPITVFTQVSFTGAVVQRAVRGHRRYLTCYGQCADALRHVTAASAPVNPYELATLWNRWHLNGMRAACIHQQAIGNTVGYQEWIAQSQEETAKCPLRYRYGSEWLVEVIPDAALERIRQIAELLAEQPVLDMREL